jgi:hypothetical protein
LALIVQMAAELTEGLMKRPVAALAGIVASFLLAASSAIATETVSYTYDSLGRLVAVESDGTVNDNQSTDIEYDELGNRTGYTADDGTSPANLAIGNASVTEGGTLSFTVTRSGNTSIAASASYATANGTAVASGDYTSKTGTVSFTSGQTSKTVTVTTIDDSNVESSETMTVTLSNPSSGAAIIDNSGTGTINDNDSTPANLAIGNASVTEGGTLSFTVTRSGNTSIAASASYATSNQTAVAPGDYTAKSGTVSFSSGQTSKTITVTTIDDSTTESTETMKVTLSNPSSGAAITTAVGTGTINDNDTTWSSSLTAGSAVGCGGYCGYTGYSAGAFGSMTNTAFNGYTVTGVYSVNYSGGAAYILTLSGSSVPPNSGWTSITIPGAGTLNRASAGYSTGTNTATWTWAGSSAVTSGTVTIQ